MADERKRVEIHIDTDFTGQWAPRGERRSQVALTVYPLLMEAYRLSWEDASVANMLAGGRESVNVRTEINVSVRTLVHMLHLHV